MTALRFILLVRRFEPLVSDSADDGDELAGSDGDQLAVWWQYIQAVQDSLPNDQQVLVPRISI